MATINGTGGADHLIGGPDADVLNAWGGSDTLEGGAGGDHYALIQQVGHMAPSSIRISDASVSGAPDMVTGLRSLPISARRGVDDAGLQTDDLELHVNGKASWFRHKGYGAVDLAIENHFAGHAVEKIEFGGVIYRALTGLDGYGLADLFAGGATGEIVRLRHGDDLAFGNGGDDTIYAGHGDDRVIGGAGDDVLRLARGNDYGHGGDGDDRIYGGYGLDELAGGGGADDLFGGGNDDRLDGGAGNDRLRGGGGWDRLAGGEGDDRLFGGHGGDVYAMNAAGAGFGHDIIHEGGRAATYDAARGMVAIDTLEVSGIYGPPLGRPENIADSMTVSRVGNDMALSFNDGASSVTVRGQFAAGGFGFIEKLQFNADQWIDRSFMIAAADRQGVNEGRINPGGGLLNSKSNELLFGTDGDNRIFGDSGRNLIWTGDGNDVLEYRLGDVANDEYSAEYYTGAMIDTVMDFDVTRDRLDFQEIAGLGFQNIVVSEDAEGDARLHWSAGSAQFADIEIELRGVGAAEVSADFMFFA